MPASDFSSIIQPQPCFAASLPGQDPLGTAASRRNRCPSERRNGTHEFLVDQRSLIGPAIPALPPPGGTRRTKFQLVRHMRPPLPAPAAGRPKPWAARQSCSVYTSTSPPRTSPSLPLVRVTARVLHPWPLQPADSDRRMTLPAKTMHLSLYPCPEWDGGRQWPPRTVAIQCSRSPVVDRAAGLPTRGVANARQSARPSLGRRRTFTASADVAARGRCRAAPARSIRG